MHAMICLSLFYSVTDIQLPHHYPFLSVLIRTACLYTTFCRYGWLKSMSILVLLRTVKLWKKLFQKLYGNLYVSFDRTASFLFVVVVISAALSTNVLLLCSLHDLCRINIVISILIVCRWDIYIDRVTLVVQNCVKLPNAESLKYMYTVSQKKRQWCSTL